MFGLILDSFVWLLDLIICLIVFFVTLWLVAFIGLLISRYFKNATRRVEEWVWETTEHLSTGAGVLVLLLGIAVACRSLYLTFWKQHESIFTVTLLWNWLPFQLLQNYYNVDMCSITIYINKFYLIFCMLLAIPMYGVAVSKLSNVNRPFTKIGFWVSEQGGLKLTHGDKDKDKEYTYHEFSEENLLKSLYMATVSNKERQIEKEMLESEINRLQKSSVKLRGQVKKEQNKNISLLMKVADQEKKLQEQEKELASKRPRSMRDWQSRVDDCMCVICMERTRQYNIKPCNHFCVCNICKPTLKNRCPLCRIRVQRFERIYLNLE